MIFLSILNCASGMDTVLLLIQAKCHLSVIENMNLENIIIIQNKIDLIREEYATEHYKQIKSFV